MGYSKKAIKGLGWVSSLQVLSKGIIFVKYIVIARFLFPSELGLFGISMLTISFLQSMTETGISAFLVHKDNSEEYVSSAWIVTIARGLVLFLLAVLIADPISVFFNSPDSLRLILVASLIPLIGGFINPAAVKFQKNLDFNKQFIYRFVITLSDFAASVLLIVIFKNAFALVIAVTFSTFVETALSLLFITPKPRFIFEKKKLTEIFHFGKWLTLVVSTNYFSQQLDSIVVGKLLGTTSLGIYQFAQKFSLQIMSDAGDVFSTVTFPLFSKIKDDIQRTKKALLKILLSVTLLFGTITLFLILFSNYILTLLVGQRWLGADIPLKIFSLTGLITAFMAIITSLFLAHARQDITAKMLIIRLIIIAIFIIPVSVKFGIIGASFTSLISFIFVIPIAIYGTKTILSKK
jgi:O-antigen/teichoic acid export membrane protein